MEKAFKIFDGHGDIWTDITVQRQLGSREVFRNRHYPKFQKGGVTGGIFVIWVDDPYDAEDPVGRSLQIVEAAKAEFAEQADILLPVRCVADFERADAEGKMAIVTGMEGAAQIGEDLDLIDFYYEEAAVRDIMLTWNDANALATAWTQDPERGLTDLGKQAVRKIQDKGINIDTSHLNEKSFWDVMRVATGPVIASHSNTRALCPLDRNLSDEMIREIGRTGGLVGMNSIRQLISPVKEKQTLDHLIDHLEHVAGIIGIDHIGLGFDFDDYLDEETLATFIFDGIESPSAENIANESEAVNLPAAMKARGFSDEDIEKVCFGNFLSLFSKTWKA